MSKTWFITGTSRGLGRVWTEAALERGDRVAATARRVGALNDLAGRFGDRLLVLPLDVTDVPAVDAAVVAAHQRFGRLDVVVNNAGFGLFGAIEEVSEQQARDQMETNFFGALWVTRAVLPIMRGQGSGHILQVSSIGGVNAWPNIGLYHASKWALEGMSQALAAEVSRFGVKVTLVEPTGYTTDWRDTSAVRADPITAYDFLREGPASPSGENRGDPEATAAVILELVDLDDPPLRLFLGDGPLKVIQAEYARRLKTWEEWADLAIRAHGTPESARQTAETGD